MIPWRCTRAILGLLLVLQLALAACTATPGTPSVAPATVFSAGLTPLPTWTPRPTWTPWQPPTRAPTATPTATPPPPPPFTGRLLLETEHSELRWLDFAGGKPRLGDALITDLRQYAVSPDGRYVVYSGLETPMTLLDLANGQTRRLGNSTSRCYAWSPSSARFAYTSYSPTPALYAYELTGGTSTKIVDFACAYYMGGHMGGGAPTSGRICGEITCGAWLDESHLLFRHYAGAMPDTVTDTGLPSSGMGPYPYIEVRAQAATIASLQDRHVTLTDLPELWFELARCPYGPYVLLRNSWDADSPDYISPVFTDAGGLRPAPLPMDGYSAELKVVVTHGSFVDRQCDIGFWGERPGWSGSTLYGLLDPVTHQEVFRSATLPDILQLNRHWVWVGDPQARRVAIPFWGGNRDGIAMVDLNTGGYTILLDSSEHFIEVAAWVAP